MASPPDFRASLREHSVGALSRMRGDHTRSILAVLRRVRPLMATRAFGYVTLADDVLEVLSDFEHFGVPAYNERMTEISGPFILGLDDTDLYGHDHRALRAAIRAEDLPMLAERTLSIARRHVRASAGRLDVVRELADPTIDEVIGAYFGTPGPDGGVQVRWARDIFAHIFLNVGASAAVRERALAAADQMRPHLDAQIAARRDELKEGHRVPDDVLARLLRDPPREGGLRDIAVRHNLIGLIAGWIPTASKAFACAVDEILRRPPVLERVRRAAREGDHETMWRCLLEALRFQPQTWALLRTCVGDHTVAAGTRRATRFRAGSRVLVATQSAMFDSRRVADPRSYRVDRPLEDYLHFGHGLHACFGREINRVHLPAMATALFEGPPVTRADTGRGLQYDGAYPASLPVQFAPGPV